MVRCGTPIASFVGVDDAIEYLCWCFEHTHDAIRDEVLATGKSAIGDSVRARIKAGECDCERLNPTGRCCLGDIATVVQAAMKERK